MRIGSYQAADAIALQQVTGIVGMGTTTPQARLDVAGRMNVSASTDDTRSSALNVVQAGWGLGI